MPKRIDSDGKIMQRAAIFYSRSKHKNASHPLVFMLLSFIFLLCGTSWYKLEHSIMTNGCIEVGTDELIIEPFTDHTLMVPKLKMGDVNLCRSLNLTHLIFVHSSPGNIHLRTNLRSTWADKDLFRHGKTKVVFFMGRPSTDQVQQMLYVENRIYGDIIQGDFDSHHMTKPINGIFALEFLIQYCSNVPYFIHSDERSIINIFEMIKLTDYYNGLFSQFIICDIKSGLPMESYSFKSNHISLKACYPKHCSEAFYALPNQLLKNLHSAIKRSKILWKDNIYTTGVLTKVSAIENPVYFVPLNANVSSNYNGLRKGYRDEESPVWPVVLTDVDDPETFTESWLLMLDRIPKQLLGEIHINWHFMAYHTQG